MKDLDIRIRNGGDDAIMAVRDLLGCPSYTDNGVAHELREYAKKLVVTDDDTAMAAELMRFAANYIDRLASLRARWIPVSERLPEDGQAVIVFWSKYKQVGEAVFGKEEGFFSTDRGGCYDISHWMPLPQPPEVTK